MPETGQAGRDVAAQLARRQVQIQIQTGEVAGGHGAYRSQLGINGLPPIELDMVDLQSRFHGSVWDREPSIISLEAACKTPVTIHSYCWLARSAAGSHLTPRVLPWNRNFFVARHRQKGRSRKPAVK